MAKGKLTITEALAVADYLRRCTPIEAETANTNLDHALEVIRAYARTVMGLPPDDDMLTPPPTAYAKDRW
jgi:hypothetical protein